MPSADDARTALALAYAVARQQWQAEGHRMDLAEYLDAALEALVGCLARYDGTRGVSFPAYARRRVQGAVQDAWARYRTWRYLRAAGPPQKPHAWALRPEGPDHDQRLDLAQRLTRLPAGAQQYAQAVLEGATDAEVAAQAGITGSAQSFRLKAWRTALAAPARPTATASRQPLRERLVSLTPEHAWAPVEAACRRPEARAAAARSHGGGD